MKRRSSRACPALAASLTIIGRPPTSPKRLRLASFPIERPAPVFREDVPQKPAAADEQMQLRRITATIERPSATNPGGVIIEALYRVVGGMVQVQDLQGNLLGTEPVGGDAEAAARKILREKKKVSAFYSPISYPKRSMH